MSSFRTDVCLLRLVRYMAVVVILLLVDLTITPTVLSRLIIKKLPLATTRRRDDETRRSLLAVFRHLTT